MVKAGPRKRSQGEEGESSTDNDHFAEGIGNTGRWSAREGWRLEWHGLCVTHWRSGVDPVASSVVDVSLRRIREVCTLDWTWWWRGAKVVFCSSYLARVSEWFGNAARFHVPLVGANSEPDWELARPNAGA